MAHPFYATNPIPKSDPSWHKLQDHIRQAAALSSNERNVKRQQAGAKERLAMELRSAEKRHNRTETRLDRQLTDNIKTNSLNRKRTSQIIDQATELFPHELSKAQSVAKYERETVDSRILYDKARAESAVLQNEQLRDTINSQEADKAIDRIISRDNVELDNIFKMDLDGGLIYENGAPVMSDNATSILQSRNANNIDEIWAELESEYPELVKSGHLNKESLRSKLNVAEAGRNADFDDALQKQLAQIKGEDGQRMDPEEIMKFLRSNYDGEAWYDQFISNVATDPESSYYDAYHFKEPEDAVEFGSSDDGNKAIMAYNQAVANNAALNSEAKTLDYAEMFDVFGNDDALRGINIFGTEMGVTDEHIDNARWGAVEHNGEKFFTFWEDDLGATRNNDVWVGRMGEDGKIYWQEPAVGYSNDPAKAAAMWNYGSNAGVWNTKDMLKQTEGAGWNATTTNSSVNYK